MNILCIELMNIEHSICQMMSRMLTPELCTSFWRTSQTILTWPSKVISQILIQNEVWIHHFDSESEQQSMEWNERIGQNCHFITLRNSIFPCRMQTTDDR